MPSDPACRRARAFPLLLAVVSCAALSCGRDLAVPLLLPPRLTAVTPPAAFAGERVLLAGEGLGNGAGSTVQIGGRSAEAAPPDATLPAGTLAVLLPAELAAGALDVTVTTAAGKSTLAGAIRSLGLGHPTGLGLQGQFDLGVFPFSLAVLGDTAWLSDLAHDEVVAIDPLTGELTGLVPLHGANSPSLVFGTSTAPWVYSVGDLGHHPQLDRFDLTGALPQKTCSSGELAAIGDGTHPAQVWGAVANADGTLLAAPTFGKSIALIDTSVCPPVVTTVALAEKAWGVVLSGREAIVALGDKFTRLLANGTLVSGAVVEDAVSVNSDGTMALDPLAPRLAYARSDGNVGLVRWSAAGGPPVVDDAFIFTYGAVQKLAFGPALSGAASDRLYVRENDRLVVYDLSGAAPALVGTAALDGVGLPIHLLPTGEVLAGQIDGTALFSRDGASLRTWTLTGALPGYSLAVGPDGRVLVPGKFGATAVLPDFSGAHTSFDAQGRAVQFDGLTGSDGPPVGWIDNLLYAYSATSHDWTVLATLPATHAALQAGRDSTGAYAAAYGWDGGLAWLDVVGPGAPVHLTLPGVDRVRLTFGAGALWVLTQTGSRASVYALDPAAPALKDPIVLDPPADYTDPLALFPFWSRGLGALVVPFADVRDTGNGTFRKVAAKLYAVAPGQPTRRSGALPRSLANPAVLSPDGRMLISLDQGQDGVDAALLSYDGDALRVTWTGHTDLPSRAADAFFSTAGDELFVTLPFLPAIAALQ